MKDTVLPFERFKNSVQIVRTLSTDFRVPSPRLWPPSPHGRGAGGEGHTTRFQDPR